MSIADFEDFCREKKLHIQRRIALNTEAGTEITEDANRNADLAIFVLGGAVGAAAMWRLPPAAGVLARGGAPAWARACRRCALA